MPDSFIDTNVFVYAFDQTAPQRRARAREIVRNAVARDGNSVISSQVVQEFLNVALTRFHTPLSPADARRYAHTVLLPMCRVWPSAELYDRAIGVHATTGFSFYDSLIVAAALLAGCRELLTEDLQHGQEVEGLVIRDPFR
ncbi:MAG: PIN domain-containing protein [Spirochaetaceae bacterium]